VSSPANSATPAPTGRARRRLGEDERREQILRGTVAAVADLGYHAASLARIAEYAGVSKGLISHYFAGRDELMAETARATVAAIRRSIAEQLDLSAPVPAVIRSAVRLVSRLPSTHREQRAALEQIVHNLRTADGGGRLSLADYEDSYQAQETLFGRGQAEGSLRAFDTRVMAVTYQSALDAMLAYLDAHPEADVDRYADALADLLLDGITA
jgi:AcrR family transcriptional regulator